MSDVRRGCSSAFARRLIIMAKQPRAGAAKRRLARGIGAVAAARFYRTTLRHTLMRLGTDARWRTYLAVAPDSARAESCWPSWPRIQRIPQGNGDLGQRMQHLFDCMPPGPVVLIGSDIPSISPTHVCAAFQQLGQADAVLGPASDGGYWLVGLKRSPRPLAPFAGVPWSTDQALERTRANLEGRTVRLAPVLNDVDNAKDLAGQSRYSERLVGLRCRPASIRNELKS